MADGYDRFENEGSGGGSFVMGLLTGTVLGAGLGMLFAPKAGSELRNQLSEQAGNLANRRRRAIAQGDARTAGDWADRGRDMYGKAKDAVAKGADEAQRYVARRRRGAATSARERRRAAPAPRRDRPARRVDRLVVARGFGSGRPVGYSGGPSSGRAARAGAD